MNFETARRNMVEGQLMPNFITNKDVLTIFGTLPREVFVDVSLKNLAYVDDVLSIGSGRYILKPMIHAYILQELNVTDADKVLVCASGTGYTAAVLSKIGADVYAVESDPSLCERARRALVDVKCKAVKTEKGDFTQGLEGEAPFDKIVYNMPVTEVPTKVLAQLKDGGVLAYLKPVSADIASLCDVVIAKKVGKKIEERVLTQTHAVPTNDNKVNQGFAF